MTPRRPSDALRRDCLARLRELGIVRSATVRTAEPGAPAPAVVVLDTPLGQRVLQLLEVRSHLTAATARGLGAQARRLHGPTLLFAPHVSREMGGRLAESRLQYVDRAGNCDLALEGGLLARVEGRRGRPETAAGRHLRAPALQVLFAWLARPGLVDAPVREVAAAAGASHSTVSNLRRQLEEEGSIVRTARGRVLASAGTLRDRWLAAYATTLRPSLLLGRHAVRAGDPLELEGAIEEHLARGEAASAWAWGGGSAAYRLTGHWHGERTTLHVLEEPAGLLAHLGAVPAREGRLVILSTPGSVGLQGPGDHVAHPLLVVAELLALDDERAAEAAAEILAGHLERGTTG